ncbi:hypothetical protein Vadar_025533 [Vaccinium darrowii]|uniref:Uncharacterized protein n=1 Tax=Vaccinium darrowii TaxID=229202 RepID=A0ACB7X3P4_9ERIC|nr:hypothetical protein Vadar_025533 [Vaccinium darrowii]
MISFTVTLSHYGYCRGLDLCLVYSLPADTVVLGRIPPLQVEISIPSRGIERSYRPRCYGIPGTGEDMVWLIHWVEGDLFKEGDVVLVKFETDGEIKDCGVSLLSCPKFEALQYWRTLKKSLESNAFQVLPLPGIVSHHLCPYIL